MNVTKAIKSAIATDEEAEPGTRDHPARTVRTGTFCLYVPTRAPRHLAPLTGGAEVCRETAPARRAVPRLLFDSTGRPIGRPGTEGRQPYRLENGSGPGRRRLTRWTPTRPRLSHRAVRGLVHWDHGGGRVRDAADRSGDHLVNGRSRASEARPSHRWLLQRAVRTPTRSSATGIQEAGAWNRGTGRRTQFSPPTSLRVSRA